MARAWQIGEGQFSLGQDIANSHGFEQRGDGAQASGSLQRGGARGPSCAAGAQSAP